MNATTTRGTTQRKKSKKSLLPYTACPECLSTDIEVRTDDENYSQPCLVYICWDCGHIWDDIMDRELA